MARVMNWRGRWLEAGPGWLQREIGGVALQGAIAAFVAQSQETFDVETVGVLQGAIDVGDGDQPGALGGEELDDAGTDLAEAFESDARAGERAAERLACRLRGDDDAIASQLILERHAVEI
jgi:hypothetical protein